MAIKTRNDYEIVLESVRREMAKPQAERDYDFLQNATTQLKAAETQFAGQVDGGSQEAVAAGAMERSVPQADPQNPNDDPRLRAFQDALVGRLEQMYGAVKRPFMSDEQQAAAAGEMANTQAERELTQEELARQLGIDPSKLNFSRTGGGLYPDIAAGFLPGGVVRGRGVAGAIGRVAGETALGAISTVADVPLNTDPTTNAAIGSLLGSGTGLISEVPGFAKNVVLNDARRAYANPETRRNLALAESAGVDLSLAEASVDRRVAAIEQEISDAPGSARNEFLRNRQRQIAREFAGIDEALNPNRMSTETVIGETRKAYTKYVQELGNIASTNFRESLRPVAQSLGATIDNQGRILGGQKVISVDNLIKEYETQLAQLGESVVGIAANERKALENAIEELNIARQNGGMTLGGAQQLLRTFTDAAYPSGSTVVRQRENAMDVLDAKALQRAFMDDLEATSQAMGPGSRAAAALDFARQQYASDIGVLDSLQGQAVDRLLGKVGGSIESEEFARNMLNMPQRQFTELMGILDNAKPGLSNAVRARVFAEIAGKHTGLLDPRLGMQAPTLDIPAFVRDFNKLGINKLRAFLDLPAEQALRVERGMQVLSFIAAGPERQASTRGALAKLEELAINAASQNPGFLSRLLAGRVGPAFFERVLFGEGLEALETLGSSAATRSAVANAVTRLEELAVGTDQEREDAIRRAKLLQRYNNFSQGAD